MIDATTALVLCAGAFLFSLVTSFFVSGIISRVRILESQMRISSARHEATLAVLTSFKEAIAYEQTRAGIVEDKVGALTSIAKEKR